MTHARPLIESLTWSYRRLSEPRSNKETKKQINKSVSEANNGERRSIANGKNDR